MAKPAIVANIEAKADKIELVKAELLELETLDYHGSPCL